MSHIVRYIDARAALTRHAAPTTPTTDAQAWHIEQVIYWVIFGLIMTGILLTWVWR